MVNTLPTTQIEHFYQKLKAWHHPYSALAVAFSGGVDSTLVLYSAVQSLGVDAVLAITADSPSLARRELNSAKQFTTRLGIRHLILASTELSDPAYSCNQEDRCYHCKRNFYDELTRTLPKHKHQSGANINWVIADGTNADDLSDSRPGLLAANEAGVLHPLLDCGIGKQLARELSRYCGLTEWNKPEMACLASRIEKGTRITEAKLAMVEDTESALRKLGFSKLRVRYHELKPGAEGSSSESGDRPAALARIELDAEDIAKAAAPKLSCKIVTAAKKAGFAYAVLDLEGYKKGGRAIKSI